MIDNLYCKLYINSDLEIDNLFLTISGLLVGKIERKRIVKTSVLEFDLRKNKDFDSDKCNREDAFLYWRYYADIEPVSADENLYVHEISCLINLLSLEGIHTIASCDFENLL